MDSAEWSRDSCVCVCVCVYIYRRGNATTEFLLYLVAQAISAVEQLVLADSILQTLGPREEHLPTDNALSVCIRGGAVSSTVASQKVLGLSPSQGLSVQSLLVLLVSVQS